MRANHFTVIDEWQSATTIEMRAAATNTKEYRNSLGPILGSPLDERLFKVVEETRSKCGALFQQSCPFGCRLDSDKSTGACRTATDIEEHSIGSAPVRTAGELQTGLRKRFR